MGGERMGEKAEVRGHMMPLPRAVNNFHRLILPSSYLVSHFASALSPSPLPGTLQPLSTAAVDNAEARVYVQPIPFAAARWIGRCQ